MKEIIIVSLVLVNSFLLVENCNESVCAPVVSKCLLIKSCNCDTQNHTCSALCHTCLGKLSTECCSCVDMCPTKSIEQLPDKQSTVVDHLDSIPGLFNAMVEIGDELMQWTAETYENNYTTSSGNLDNSCNIIWWDECTPFEKCNNQCISLGASSTRWFHNGCCECIGDTCINYGRSKIACKYCSNGTDTSSTTELPTPDEGDENLDWGEDYDFD